VKYVTVCRNLNNQELEEDNSFMFYRNFSEIYFHF
jgi:hypothetical protein